MTKTIDTLVDDIYNLMLTKRAEPGVDVESIIEDFANNIKQIMRKEFVPSTRSWDDRNIRLSSVGKPLLQQWYAARKYKGEKIQPHTLIKFMYGHMIEELVLALAELAGHVVTDQQKEVKVSGITGHMDCKIDGLTTDVKSTTKFGLMKFKDGTLAKDDDFGYVDQLKAYAHAEGETKFAWLAMDRDSGKLAVLQYDLEDKKHPMYEHYSGDIEEKIKEVKKSVEGEDQPSKCALPIADGKSGNLKLATICSYCKYKRHCYPEVRGFATGSGPKFLTTVVNVPKNRSGLPYPELDLTKGEVDYG